MPQIGAAQTSELGVYKCVLTDGGLRDYTWPEARWRYIWRPEP